MKRKMKSIYHIGKYGLEKVTRVWPLQGESRKSFSRRFRYIRKHHGSPFSWYSGEKKIF